MTQKSSSSPPTRFSSNSIPQPPSSTEPQTYTDPVSPPCWAPQDSGSAFEANRTVDIAVRISTYSAPTCNGYDVRQYRTPAATARHPAASTSVTTASYNSVSVSTGSHTVYSHISPSSHHRPSTPTASTALGSYCLAPEVNAEQGEFQSEYSGSRYQGQ